MEAPADCAGQLRFDFFGVFYSVYWKFAPEKEIVGVQGGESDGLAGLLKQIKRRESEDQKKHNSQCGPKHRRRRPNVIPPASRGSPFLRKDVRVGKDSFPYSIGREYAWASPLNRLLERLLLLPG